MEQAVVETRQVLRPFFLRINIQYRYKAEEEKNNMRANFQEVNRLYKRTRNQFIFLPHKYWLYQT